MIFIKLYQKCKQLLPSIKSPVTQIKFIRYLSKNIRSNFHFRLQSLGATRILVGRALLREAFIFKPFKSSDGKSENRADFPNRTVGLQQTQQTHILGSMGTSKKKVNNNTSVEVKNPPKPVFYGIAQVGDVEGFSPSFRRNISHCRGT